MAVLPLRFVPDPVLRQKTKRIPGMDSGLERLIDDMLETLPEVNGVGLAAPQVGASVRLAVIAMPDEEPMVLINPEIVKRSGLREVTEACLSIPGYAGEIKRAKSVTVKARNIEGKEFRVKATGLLAQALEHEVDHLEGTLYIDHVETADGLYRVEHREEKDLL